MKNIVELEGNLGSDPELRYTSGGIAVCNVNLATSYKKGDQEFTTWHRITAWNDTAEELDKFGKGDKISIKGYIKYNEWTGKDGTKNRTAEIQTNEMELIFKKGGSNRESVPETIPEDDIPF